LWGITISIVKPNKVRETAVLGKGGRDIGRRIAVGKKVHKFQTESEKEKTHFIINAGK